MAGVEINERSETAFDEVSRHWKKLEPEIQTLEKRDSDQAAKSSGVQPEPSGALSKLRVRPERAACALSWLAVPRSGIGAVGEWSPSIRSLFLFARAPEERRREDGRNEPGGVSRLDGGNRRRAASLGPTFRRADRRPRPRGRRKRRHAASVPSINRRGPAPSLLRAASSGEE